MSDVQFEGERNPFSQNVNVNSNTEPKMIRFLIKKGIVKNAEGAFKILLGITIIFILLSIYFFWSAYKKTVVSPDDPRFKFTEEQIMNFPLNMQEKLRNNGKVK